MRKARLATGLRLNEQLAQGEMADLVTAELKRAGAKRQNGDYITVSQSAWSDYEAERSEPALLIVRATSRISGLAEAEILFPGPPQPIDGSEFRYLSDDELARAHKKVAESTPSRKKASGKGSGKRHA